MLRPRRLLLSLALALAGCAAPSAQRQELAGVDAVAPEAGPDSDSDSDSDDDAVWAPWVEVYEQDADLVEVGTELELAVAEALPETVPARAAPRGSRGKGPQIARTVRRWVGLPTLRRISKTTTDDCSGLVRLAYGRAGLDPVGDLRAPDGSAVKAMYLRATRLGALRRSSPRPGDLVFFRNTYDRNRDGRRNDGVTHVGVVEKVERNGTVVFVHRGGKGVVRARLNLAKPWARTDGRGKRLNDYLRHADGSRAPRLTGQLFAGFARADAFVDRPAVGRRGR